MLLKADEWTDITPNSFRFEWKCPVCATTLIIDDPKDIGLKGQNVYVRCMVCKSKLVWSKEFRPDVAEHLRQLYYKVTYVQQDNSLVSVRVKRMAFWLSLTLIIIYLFHFYLSTLF